MRPDWTPNGSSVHRPHWPARCFLFLRSLASQFSHFCWGWGGHWFGLGTPQPKGTQPCLPVGCSLERKQDEWDSGASLHHFQDNIKYPPAGFSRGPARASEVARPWRHTHRPDCQAPVTGPRPSPSHSDRLVGPPLVRPMVLESVQPPWGDLSDLAGAHCCPSRGTGP